MDIEHVLEPLPLIVAAATGAAAAFLFFKTISEQSQDPSTGDITHSTYAPTMVALQGAGVGLAVQIVVRITGVS